MYIVHVKDSVRSDVTEMETMSIAEDENDIDQWIFLSQEKGKLKYLQNIFFSVLVFLKLNLLKVEKVRQQFTSIKLSTLYTLLNVENLITTIWYDEIISI